MENQATSIRPTPKQLVLLASLCMWFSLGCLAALAQSSSSAAVAPQPTQDAPVQAPSLAKVTPPAPVTVLEDTPLRLLTSEPINSKRAEEGTSLLFTLSEDVMVGDVLAIPRCATVRGVVVKSKKAGVLTGSPTLTLKLVSLTLGGRSYPLDSYQYKVTGTSKTKPTETKALRGAAVGAVAGATLGGRAANMTAGAVVGAGVGTLVSAATPGPGIWIPSESQIDFNLAAPVTVMPVSAKEAARLAQGLHAGGPVLYVRGETP